MCLWMSAHTPVLKAHERGKSTKSQRNESSGERIHENEQQDTKVSTQQPYIKYK